MDTDAHCQICTLPGVLKPLACHPTHKLCAACTDKVDYCPFCRAHIPGRVLRRRRRYLPKWFSLAFLALRYVLAPLLQSVLPEWLWRALMIASCVAFLVYSAHYAVQWMRSADARLWWARNRRWVYAMAATAALSSACLFFVAIIVWVADEYHQNEI